MNTKIKYRHIIPSAHVWHEMINEGTYCKPSYRYTGHKKIVFKDLHMRN